MLWLVVAGFTVVTVDVEETAGDVVESEVAVIVTTEDSGWSELTVSTVGSAVVLRELSDFVEVSCGSASEKELTVVVDVEFTSVAKAAV